jgi:hypothetical protein
MRLVGNQKSLGGINHASSTPRRETNNSSLTCRPESPKINPVSKGLVTMLDQQNNKESTMGNKYFSPQFYTLDDCRTLVSVKGNPLSWGNLPPMKDVSWYDSKHDERIWLSFKFDQDSHQFKPWTLNFDD